MTTYDLNSAVTLEDVGITAQPARTYAVTVSADLTAADGQVLGYTWTAGWRTGTAAPSRASAAGTASGNRAAGGSCPSTPQPAIGDAVAAPAARRRADADSCARSPRSRSSSAPDQRGTTAACRRGRT
jgi:hypothetical protein